MIPAIVNKPDPMVKMRVISVKDETDETLKLLHRIGLLHIEDSEELTHIDRARIEKERRDVSSILAEIENVLSYIPADEKILPGDDIEVTYAKPYGETKTRIQSLISKLNTIHQELLDLQQQIDEEIELDKYLKPLIEQDDLKLTDLSFDGKYLFSDVYIFAVEVYEVVQEKLAPILFGKASTNTADMTVLHVVAKKADKAAVESVINSNGGRKLAVPSSNEDFKDFLERNSRDIEEKQNQKVLLTSQMVSETKSSLRDLVLLREALRNEINKISALQQASEAKYVTLIEGWIPRRDVDHAITEIKTNIDYSYIDIKNPTKKDRPPTKMNNPRALKPFQVIVNLFGTPKYDEWDPTPIIAYSFALFFGIMLGDVIYALCLIVLTRVAIPRLVDDPDSEGTRLFKRILYISCGSSLIIGLLTGTYLGDFYRFFGIENPALSQHISALFSDTLLFIIISLGIGLIHVNIGHLLALIKGIKTRQFYFIPGKIGLFLLQIAGIPWIMRFLGMEVLALPPAVYSSLPYLMLASIILIVIASIAERGYFMGSIFWLFEITGILGDVMSYARLAGVGLATYYLAFCFNLMGPLLAGLLPAGIIRMVFGTILIIAVLLVGHMVNLILSSLTCFVHSLRLCFVEFLFKFYEAGGRPYNPFHIRKREMILVKERG